MKTLVGIFISMWALTFVCRAENLDRFEYGPRPATSVFDPYDFLSAGKLDKISKPLQRMFREEGLDIVVVVLNGTGDAPPEHVASRFAAAWCKSEIHCVVLHVPEKVGSPWIVPSGKLIDYLIPEEVEQAVNDAQRRARSEPDDDGKVEAATMESADMLRFWTANALIQDAALKEAIAKFRREQGAQHLRLKILAALIPVSFVVLAVTVILLIILLQNRGPKLFPVQLWEVRLGAPYAGGGQPVVILGKLQKKS